MFEKGTGEPRPYGRPISLFIQVIYKVFHPKYVISFTILIKRDSLLENMNYLHKKVIIADVDETICESCQVISDEMATKINSLIAQGFIVAFVSGTHQSELKRMISNQIKGEHHILANTGTHYCVMNNETEKEIHNEVFSTKEKEEILSAIAQVVQKFSLVPLTSAKDQIQDRGSQITLVALGRNAPIEIKKAYDPDGKKRLEMLPLFENLLNHEEKKYEIKVAGTTSIDITRKGIDKEWAIRKFVNYYEISFSDILFFGDKIYPGGNDYPASKIVDCISVKNPNETLKRLYEIFPKSV